MLYGSPTPWYRTPLAIGAALLVLLGAGIYFLRNTLVAKLAPVKQEVATIASSPVPTPYIPTATPEPIPEPTYSNAPASPSTLPQNRSNLPTSGPTEDMATALGVAALTVPSGYYLVQKQRLKKVVRTIYVA